MQAPTRINLHRSSKILELQYGTDIYQLSCEFLRVHSPSAEVKGHGPGQEVLQFGKQHVGISDIQSAGNYALQFTFDDGHDSGIYSWDYLRKLCLEQDELWNQYLERLHQAGKRRDPNEQAVQLIDPKG